MRTRHLFFAAAAMLATWLLWGAQPASAQIAAQQSVDVNQASEAQLDGVKGLGPATTRRILAARSKRPFDDWNDFIARVKGIGPRFAERLSREGLTVAGAPYPTAAQEAANSAPTPAAQR